MGIVHLSSDFYICCCCSLFNRHILYYPKKLSIHCLPIISRLRMFLDSLFQILSSDDQNVNCICKPSFFFRVLYMITHEDKRMGFLKHFISQTKCTTIIVISIVLTGSVCHISQTWLWVMQFHSAHVPMAQYINATTWSQTRYFETSNVGHPTANPNKPRRFRGHILPGKNILQVIWGLCILWALQLWVHISPLQQSIIQSTFAWLKIMRIELGFNTTPQSFSSETLGLFSVGQNIIQFFFLQGHA